MTIKQIICYETSDGKIWRTEKQAEWWEDVCNKYSKAFSPPMTEYNMRNEGYTNTHFPVGRD